MPRIVYDPDEGQVREIAMSELTRSIFIQEKVASDRSIPKEDRDAAGQRAERLSRIADHHATGDVEIADMTTAELDLFAKLTGGKHVAEFGLIFGLGPGEAACLAIALERRLVLATDDSDALKAMRKIRAKHPYQRIRRMLVSAAADERISEMEANQIHADMCAAGFRDTEEPFPGQ